MTGDWDQMDLALPDVKKKRRVKKEKKKFVHRCSVCHKPIKSQWAIKRGAGRDCFNKKLKWKQMELGI